MRFKGTHIFPALLLTFLTMICPASLLAQHSNCGVAPYENTHTQPDGSRLTLKALGNEAIHYLETREGYTVLKNQEGYFEYAALDAKGNLTTSGVIARDGQEFKNGVPHLRYSPTQARMMTDYFNQLRQTTADMGKAGPNPFPPTGVRRLLVILVEYPDLKSVYPKENFELLLNQPNYNSTGSFRDYYLATSNGKLEVNSTVYGWVMADSGYKYYGRNSSPSYSQATRRLLLNAMRSAHDSFDIDFSQFDSDDDGYVDGVIIMHSGIGAEEASAPNSGDFIWSFRSTLPVSQQPTYDGVKVAAYAMFPERRYNSGNHSIVGIGVMCHEFGHLLDLPDLYSTSSTNEGAGNYSLMAGGCWLNNERTPALNDAWSRISMGWITPTIINGPETYTLNRFVADSDMVYKISTTRTNEYYLLENRQRKGFDRYLPAKGLAIWHINTNFARLLSVGSGNNVNNDTSQLGVGLMQADGQRQLERNVNRGDANDLYPLAANNSFGPLTRPASILHYKVAGIRQPSNISVLNIIQNADSSITFGFRAAATSSFNGNKLSGCSPLEVAFTNHSVGADAYLWDFGNGQTSTELNPSVTYTQAGTFKVRLFTYLEDEVVDSSEQTINVSEAPEIIYSYERSDTAYQIYFNNNTSAAAFQWQFNNSLTSSAMNPIITMGGPGLLYVKLIAYSTSGCISEKYDTINFFTLGLNTNAAGQMKLNAYPNPFSSALRIDFELTGGAEDASVEVYNMLGERVYRSVESRLQGGPNSLLMDGSSLSNGIYLIKVITPGRQAWMKVLKE